MAKNNSQTRTRNPRSRGNSRRTNDSKFKKDDKDFERSVKTDKANDPAWYTRSEALAADAGRISFTYPVGLAYDFDYPIAIGNVEHSTINGLGGGKLNVPSVMSIEYVPTYGQAKDGFSAINIAAQRIYSKVRYENSGARNYFEPDLMLYLMACDQIYTLYIHMARAYGVIRDQNQLNRAVPKVLLNAMGFDYDELLHNQANFRSFLNTSAARIASLAVPNTLPIFLRHMELPLSVYKDNDDPKAQLYLFRPQAFGIYKEKSSDRGGYLKVKFMSYKRHLTEWMELLSEMISAVRDSEDCGIISGDIIKAFGADNLLRMPAIGDDYATDIGYHPEMLGQIANVTIMPEPVYPVPEGFEEAPMIYQDPDANILKSDIYFWKSGGNQDYYSRFYLGKRMMIGLTDQPDVSEVLVNSRFMVIPDSYENTTSPQGVKYYCDHVGSEVAVNGKMFSQYEMEDFYEAASPGLPDYCQLHYFNLRSLQFGAAVAKLSAFNYHPVVFDTTSTGGPSNVAVTMDVDNFAIVEGQDIARMHDTCLLSMLDVPAAGYTIK